MKKRNFFFIGIIVVLAGVYVFFFTNLTNWFKPATIEIRSTSFQGTVHFAFGQNQGYQLTEIKVVPLAEWETNKSVLPVWHLVSTDGSDSMAEFTYGENLGGMQPAVGGARPLPLQPGIIYRMFITAGSVKASHDFQVSQPVSR